MIFSYFKTLFAGFDETELGPFLQMNDILVTIRTSENEIDHLSISN